MTNRRIIVLLAVALWGARPAQAASAVAVGVGSDGKLKYGWAASGRKNLSEEEVKNRAIGYCMTSGSLKPRIIASTSKRGYGVIMQYQRADGKMGFTASVGAASEQDAIKEAGRKAKAAGGSKGEVVRTWKDMPQTVIKL